MRVVDAFWIEAGAREPIERKRVPQAMLVVENDISPVPFI
jgi:hypothetical protein